jgi:hypothetical protein
MSLLEPHMGHSLDQQVDEEISFGGRSRVASFGKKKQLFTIQEGAVEPSSLPDYQGSTLDTIYEDQEEQVPAISDVVQIPEVASKVMNFIRLKTKTRLVC